MSALGRAVPRPPASKTVGALVVVLALVGGFCLFLPAPPAGEAVQVALVEGFGIGAPAALGLLLLAGWSLLARRRALAEVLAPLRWFGLALVAAAGVILLGLWRPEWTAAGRPLAEITAGGLAAGALAGLIAFFIKPLGTFLLAVLLALFGLHLLIDLPLSSGARALFRGGRGLVRLVFASAQAVADLLERPEPSLSSEFGVRSSEFPASPAGAEAGATGTGARPHPSPHPEGEGAPLGPAPAGETPALPAGDRTVWQLPELGLLEKAPEADSAAPVDGQVRKEQLERALKSLGVDARVVEVHQGPAVTQFGVEPGWDVKTREVRERDPNGRFKIDKDGRPKVRIEEISRTRVKVSRITGLSNDLALAMAAPSIRIEAPVPGRPVVGIEVPNALSATVTVRGLIESNAFQKLLPRARLALALGKNVAGDAVVADLARMPHLLIAGSTGSGKSVCLNSIVACLLIHYTPDEVRFLMVDPKRVELTPYNQVPHLLAPVVVDVEKVVGVLKWTIQEMDARYRRFAETGTRNIDGYNGYAERNGEEKLPYLVLIIDELADLMMVAPDEVERMLCRLAQLARATGIHLIVATQRPSVDVVTGLIKANFPTRISFAVASQVDSRTILDQPGAEKLLGRGDMLYLPTDAAKPHRLQGPYLSDQEIERLVAFWRGLRPPNYIEDILNPPDDGADEDEPLMEEVRKLLSRYERVSTSLLQRKLRIGYNRAAGIIEMLEEEGLVGPPDANRSREVLWREEPPEEEGEEEDP
jgi:S-DNA-T family DNA segregation ATPase FtsK/SpoIIIE